MVLSANQLREQIGMRILICREQAGLSQQDMADDCSDDILHPICQQTVSNWERGHDVPKLTTLIRVSEVLGVNLHWLLTGQGSPRLPRKRELSK